MTGAMDDFREPGVTMDLDCAEELCRKMMNPVNWSKEYRNIDISIHCRCGWCGGRKGLVVKHEVEISRRENRHLHYGHPDLVATVAETCPNCGRWLFADGRWLCSKMMEKKDET